MKRIIPEEEKRLSILYALDQLGPCTDTQLLRFMLDIDLMNYFTLQLGLIEMAEQGLLIRRPHPIGDLSELTDAGRFTLSGFKTRIPISIRQLIDEAVPEHHQQFQLEQQTPSTCYQLPEGKCCLHLQLMDGYTVQMSLMLGLKEMFPYMDLSRRWELAAPEVMQRVTMMQLTRMDMPDAPLPEGTMITHTAEGLWRLTAAFGPEGEEITMMLLAPDEAMCRSCALCWADEAADLKQSILQLLDREPPKHSPSAG